MAKARMSARLVGACLLFCGAAAPALAQPSVEQALSYKPKQEGVLYAIPTPGEQATCKVEPVRRGAGIIGWLLVDGKKQPLRRYVDSNGDKKIDTWAYYRDGQEVYREFDSNANDRADQFRWLNSGGMKWGLDINEDGKIDNWKIISADEVAQEVFLAAMNSDFARLRALFISENELQTLRLSAELSAKVRSQLGQAQKKFEKLVREMPPISDKTQVGRVDPSPPHCIPADTAGGDQDVFHYPSRSILFDRGDSKDKAEGKVEWMQTGELIQVGMAWRLIDGPALGLIGPDDPGGGGAGKSENLKKLEEELARLDEKYKGMTPPQGVSPEMVQYNLKRVEIIEKILVEVKDGGRDPWVKQMAENLSTAAQSSPAEDKSSLQKLQALRDQLTRSAPNGNLAGYVAFRYIAADYYPKLADTKNPDIGKHQAAWLEELTKFVQAFPKVDDTPDALNYLAMGCEFVGKDEEAKRWYQQLAASCPPENPLGLKAKGAVERLNLVGNPMHLTGKTMTGNPFDMASLKGKLVVVYYWASYCHDVRRDLDELKKLHGTHSSKGFEVVTVNLDEQAEKGMTIIQGSNLPGAHLCQPNESGGLTGTLGVQYGINTVPTLFLIGKDGKVIRNSIQVGDLEAAVQKAL